MHSLRVRYRIHDPVESCFDQLIEGRRPAILPEKRVREGLSTDEYLA